MASRSRLKDRQRINFAIQRALAAVIALPSAALLAGCPECTDDSSQAQYVVLPPVRCDGTLITDSGSSCPSGTKETVYPLPDGGTSDSFYESRAAWIDGPCADGCKALGLEAVSCNVDTFSHSQPNLRCDVRHAGGCDLSVPGKGRRPDGFAGAVDDADDVGTFFVVMGELEDASVPAFRRLKLDLARIGAPKRLRRAASRAAREERRHTRAAFAFARRSRRTPLRATLPAHDRGRSVEDLARENAVEGCVHELHGAAVAAWAAVHGRDHLVRALMARVAEEEASHAALGYELARFFDTRLDAAARARVRRSAHEAARSLRSRLGEFPELVAHGLVPSRAAHAQLLEALEQGPWRMFEGP